MPQKTLRLRQGFNRSRLIAVGDLATRIF